MSREQLQEDVRTAVNAAYMNDVDLEDIKSTLDQEREKVSRLQAVDGDARGED